jgi:SH3-like domain-containing protein
MLKLIYTASGFSIEIVEEVTLEGWISTRVLLALRSAMSIFVEPSSASFLLARDLPQVNRLTAIADRDFVTIDTCDAEYIEVGLQGTWVGTNADSNDGVFVCSLYPALESLIYEVWQETQLHVSVLSE